MLTKEELIAFEADIAAEFNAGKIRAPIHLSGGNEDQLIEIFRRIEPTDWVCSTWRSHYHALLHGVPQEKVKAAIMAGKSITLCFPEHRFITSAIVGGIIPIAVGLAWAEKQVAKGTQVWCFVGDMTSCTGIFVECRNYKFCHHLPLNLVIEWNGLSVCTQTRDVWPNPNPYSHPDPIIETSRPVRTGPEGDLLYRYKLPWPHSGAGKRVEF